MRRDSVGGSPHSHSLRQPPAHRRQHSDIKGWSFTHTILIFERGALQADTVQGFEVNANLDELRQARLILMDSVGAGMTRSSFIQKI